MNSLRFSGSRCRRNVLGRDDRPLDDEDVELSFEDVLREFRHALRCKRRARDDAAGLDLADALADELGLDRLGVDVLDHLRLLGRERPAIRSYTVMRVFVARPETFEVQDGEAAELADIDRGLRRDDCVHGRSHERERELPGVEGPGDVDVVRVPGPA